MKTIEERVDDIMKTAGVNTGSQAMKLVKPLLVAICKDQDLVTIEACAENVERLRSSSVRIGGFDCVSIDQIITEIKNTKAV